MKQRPDTKPTGKKVHRNFKIASQLDKWLRRDAAAAKKKKILLTQTGIVEIALAEYFAVKRDIYGNALN